MMKLDAQKKNVLLNKMADFLSTSISRINTLDPRLVSSATRVFEKCHKEEVPIYIVWGYRSIEEQNLLYRFGRTIPGDLQTLHRGGYSAHNYGRALDFCLVYNNKTLLDWNHVATRKYWRIKWLKVVRLFDEEGWDTGWRWPSFEPGHVQNLLNESVLDLYGKTDFGNDRK